MLIGVFEAKTRLSELVERAERGEEIVITRRGAPVVRLQPVVRKRSRQEIDELLARVRERRAAMPPTTWAELKRDRDEGRR